jgi:hypothetical protein
MDFEPSRNFGEKPSDWFGRSGRLQFSMDGFRNEDSTEQSGQQVLELDENEVVDR